MLSVFEWVLLQTMQCTNCLNNSFVCRVGSLLSTSLCSALPGHRALFIWSLFLVCCFGQFTQLTWNNVAAANVIFSHSGIYVESFYLFINDQQAERVSGFFVFLYVLSCHPHYAALFIQMHSDASKHLLFFQSWKIWISN